MRVLHIGKFYPPYRGGMESHLGTLCGALAREIEVRAIVSNDGRSTVAETIDGVEVLRLGTAIRAFGAALSPGAAREIRRAGADVVHLHHPNPGAFVAWLASGSRAPLVVTYHSDIVRQRRLGALIAPLLDRVFRRASVILASSPDYAASSPVLRRFADRVRVVPFGIGDEAFAPPAPERVARLRDAWGERVVLGVGRLVYYKGFEYLVRAMREVRGTLVLVGGGPLEGELRRIAAEVGVADRVVFAGAVPDLRPCYAAADVFALPAIARSEAFGIVQLEAMASGLPVVNTRIESGVPYVSPDGVSGITVPPADPAALAAALTRLLDDPALRDRFGEAGRARVRNHFSLDDMVTGTLTAYRDALAGPRPRGGS
jgi:glycosyltransferase involved in cell wall biosynthesis